MSTLAKKLRKLRRDPGKFAADFLTNRKRQIAALRKQPATRVTPGSVKALSRYSVVSAVYNVESYLDEYFTSLVSQTVDFESSIELVMVDDGSPDRSADIIRKWARRYPRNIKYVRKENGGQASARNVGLQHATARWVTFIDPDDFVAPNYFEEVDLMVKAAKTPPAMVSCNFVFYYEQGKRESDTHPLKYRFAKGTKTVDLAKDSGFMQLSVNSAFFDAEIIARNGLRFAENVRPNFEDAHFANRYLLYVPGRTSIFAPKARYLYRKRSDGTSTLDTSWEKEGLFSDVLEHGVLALMRAWVDKTGSVPVFVQRTVLYHLMWYFKRLVNNDKVIAFLSEEQRARFLELLHEVFKHIDIPTIDKFDLAGIWYMQRVGLLGTFKGTAPNYQIVYVEDVDFKRRLLKLRYFAPHVGFEYFCADGEEVDPIFATTRVHTLVSASFVEERIVWLPLRPHAKLSVELECADVRLSLKGKQHKTLAISSIIEHFQAPALPAAAKLSWRARLIARMADSEWARKKYGAAWVLMDRDVQADDNAEHLYRYISHSQKHINAHFLLSRKSHDWRRLKREGFKLVPFGGTRHKLLMLNTEHLISSHIDAYVVNGVEPEKFGKTSRHRTTFLQHGVTKDDLSDWLNTKDIDCLVTCAPREYSSIADAGTRYKFSSREVVLTGFPRHDRLAEQDEPERIILVMPTWRLSLAGASRVGTSKRDINPDFASSEYFKEWNGLLSSEEFSALTRRHGYRVVFFPHANVQAYCHLFQLPNNVEVLTHASGSIQDVFRKAAVMITDYSSVAFEFAIMRRPVVYFQFDREVIFDGAHSYAKGYFDYDTDAFGPVCEQRDGVLSAIDQILEHGAQSDAEYLARAEAFLPFRDGRNCERTFEAIAALDAPASASEPSVSHLLRAIEQASNSAKWEAVVERSARFPAATDADAVSQSRVAILCSRAWRNLGNGDKARELLDAANLESADNVDAIIEYAEIASMRCDWEEAIARWKRAVPYLRGVDESIAQRARQCMLCALRGAQRDEEALRLALTFSTEAQSRELRVELAAVVEIAIELGEFDHARVLALRVLGTCDVATEAPQAGKAYAALAVFHRGKGDALKSLGMWMKALRCDPSEPVFAAEITSAIEEQAQWTVAQWEASLNASAMFADIVGETEGGESSSEIDVAVCLATAHRKLGDTEVAKQLIELVRLTQPQDPFALLEAGELALADGDAKQAEAHFKAAHATGVGARLDRVARGLLIACVATGALEGLRPVADALFYKRAGDCEVVRAFSTLASAEQCWDDARRGWSAMFELTPAHAGPERAKAAGCLLEALRRLGRLDEAQHLVDALVDEGYRDAEMMRARAELATEREDWSVAAQAWMSVETNASGVDEQRHASRMAALALWWLGDEASARARMWREIEASAFTALAGGDAALAIEQVSHLAVARQHPAELPQQAVDHMHAKDRHIMNVAKTGSTTGPGQIVIGAVHQARQPNDFFVEADGHA